MTNKIKPLYISYIADPLIIISHAFWDIKGDKNCNNLHPFLSHYESDKNNQWINNKAYGLQCCKKLLWLNTSKDSFLIGLPNAYITRTTNKKCFLIDSSA